MVCCVYQIYTFKLVVLVVCIPGMQQVLCVYGGMVAKFQSLRRIGCNSAENGGYLRNFRQISCKKSDITYMYMYHLFQTDILYHVKILRYADIAISLLTFSSFVSRVFFFHSDHLAFFCRTLGTRLGSKRMKNDRLAIGPQRR